MNLEKCDKCGNRNVMCFLCVNNKHYRETKYSHNNSIRNNAIDEFAERLKERLKGMQMVELQGEDVCPCSETGEECPYINQDIGCQYCAREQTIKDIDEIAEKMKGGGNNAESN